jgi:hypothetical protein
VVELEGDDESAFELARAAVRAQASSSEPSSSEPSSSEPSSSEPWTSRRLVMELERNAGLQSRKARVEAHAMTIRRELLARGMLDASAGTGLAHVAKHARELSRALDAVASELTPSSETKPTPADGPDEETGS